MGFLEWVTVQDLADALRVSTATVRRWLAQGRLPAQELWESRVRRWKRETIVPYMQNGPAPIGTFSEERHDE